MTKPWRVWVALLAAPLCLAVAFLPVVAYLLAVRGVATDALQAAIEPLAPWPASVGFAASFVVTRGLARRDGVSLEALGWARPGRADVVVGLAAAAALWAVHQLVLAPAVHRAQPSFDPALARVAFAPALLMMSAGVVAEDTLYRGYALDTLRAKWGPVPALAVTSFAYALLAPGAELPLKAWAFGFGLVLGGLKLWRGSLWPVALVHLAVVLGPKLLATITGAP